MSNEKIEKMLYDAQEKLPTTNAEWRVSDMVEKNIKKDRFHVNKAVVAAGLVLLISYATGNVITFAMTGNSLIKTATNAYDLWATSGVARENVVINGNMEAIRESIRKGEIPSQEVEGSAITITDRYLKSPEADEDYLEEWVMYDFDYKGEKSSTGYGYYKDFDYSNRSIIEYVLDGQAGSVTYICNVIEENGRIYLDVTEEKIDITFDFEDGKASGEFIETSGALAGKKLSYTVEGNLEEYIVEIKLVIDEY